MENPIKMDDLGGNTTIFGNTHLEGNIFNGFLMNAHDKASTSYTKT